MKLFFLFWKDDVAGGLVECSLIIALVTLACVAALTSLESAIEAAFKILTGSL